MQILKKSKAQVFHIGTNSTIEENECKCLTAQD